MNAETWLQRALFDLPEPVLEPLRQEYLEHLKGAQASGMEEAEALATLGNPWVVNQELRRMYGRPYPQGPGIVLLVRFLVPVMALPHLYLLLASLSRLRSPFPPDLVELLPPVLALITLVALWWLTRRLGLRRQLAWRSTGIVLSIAADNISRELLRGPMEWRAESFVIYPVLVVLALVTAHLSDQIARRIECLTGRPT